MCEIRMSVLREAKGIFHGDQDVIAKIESMKSRQFQCDECGYELAELEMIKISEDGSGFGCSGCLQKQFS